MNDSSDLKFSTEKKTLVLLAVMFFVLLSMPAFEVWAAHTKENEMNIIVLLFFNVIFTPMIVGVFYFVNFSKSNVPEFKNLFEKYIAVISLLMTGVGSISLYIVVGSDGENSLAYVLVMLLPVLLNIIPMLINLGDSWESLKTKLRIIGMQSNVGNKSSFDSILESYKKIAGEEFMAGRVVQSHVQVSYEKKLKMLIKNHRKTGFSYDEIELEKMTKQFKDLKNKIKINNHKIEKNEVD